MCIIYVYPLVSALCEFNLEKCTPNMSQLYLKENENRIVETFDYESLSL